MALELGWCADKVRQGCAFVSLPDGRSVYLEQRRAARNVKIEVATSGNVTLFDDPRWVYQPTPRAFFGVQGTLKPETGTLDEGNWVNVDDRLGYAVLGSDRFRLFAVPGRPCIWRGDGTMYHTCRMEFAPLAPAAEKTVPAAFDEGDVINRFGMVSCPNQAREETAALARRIGRAGWHVAEDGVLALMLDPYVVYLNCSSQTKSLPDNGQTHVLAPKTSGWVTRGRSSNPRSVE
jgi:hypothetical protein